MMQNAPTLPIVAVHTAENEPLKSLGVIQFNIQSCPALSVSSGTVEFSFDDNHDEVSRAGILFEN